MSYDAGGLGRFWSSSVSRLNGRIFRGGNAAMFDSLKELLPRMTRAPRHRRDRHPFSMTEMQSVRPFYRFAKLSSLLREEMPTLLQHPATSKMSGRHPLPLSRRNVMPRILRLQR